MASISRERMGNATSLFNLMRNIGGSIGIAATSTMLSRQQQATAAMLRADVTPYNPVSQAVFQQMRGAFVAGGSDATTATSRAYAVLNGMVQRQAAMVSFVGLFQLLAVLFFLMLPLILIMKRPKAGGAAVAAH